MALPLGHLMRPLTRTLLRLPWTLSQLGLDRLEKTLVAERHGDGPLFKAGDAFDATLRVLGAQFEVLLADAFKAEGYLHAEPVNKALAAFGPTGTVSSEALKWGFDLGSRTADTLAPWIGDGANAVVLQELRNKLHSFSTFRYVDAVLGLAPGDQTSLGELLARVDRLDSYTAVWATEGLGYYYAERARKAGRSTRRLLAEGAVRALPSRYKIALHAGLGLSLARQYLGQLPYTAGTRELDRVVRRFMDHCRTAAQPGYAPVSFEALGLVTRLLYPQWVETIDRILAVSLPDQAAFWHGVGRGLYFLPTNILPASHAAARTLKTLLAEVPHEAARLNAVSGLAWPLSLVNIYHPEVMEAFLKHQGDLLDRDEAFSVGVGSALITWHDLTEDVSYRTVFCHHQPDPADADAQARWERQIKEPGLRALNQYYDAIRQENAFGELFRYQPLADLVASLKQRRD
jgi:hypothetical protein